MPTLTWGFFSATTTFCWFCLSDRNTALSGKGKIKDSWKQEGTIPQGKVEVGGGKAEEKECKKGNGYFRKAMRRLWQWNACVCVSLSFFCQGFLKPVWALSVSLWCCYLVPGIQTSEWVQMSQKAGESVASEWHLTGWADREREGSHGFRLFACAEELHDVGRGQLSSKTGRGKHLKRSITFWNKRTAVQANGSVWV